jgi:putative transposase
LPERAELREVRVTRRVGDRFYAIFQIGLPEPETQWRPAPTVGIDVGVRTFARLSNGEPIEGPCAGKAAMAKTRRLQRSLARKRKGSRRRAKAVALLARHREREQARRINEAHRESRKLVDRFGVIAVEELVVGNLVRSARGTVDDPGMNVSAKRALNRSITDQAWSRFVFMLAYKAEEAGGRVVRVAPKGTSQTCAVCGACDRRSRPGGGSRFRCTGCGHAGDADTNAARVILHRAREKMKSEQHQGPGRGLQAQTPALAGVA